MSRLCVGVVAVLVVALPAASANAAARAKGVQTFRCPAAAFEAAVDPAGLVQVAALRFDNAHRALPTGVTLAALTPAHGRAGQLCAVGRAPLIRTSALVGPWPRAVVGRIFCARDALVGWSQPARYMAFQFRPVLDRKRRRVGTEMLVSVNAAPALRIRLTRSGGAAWFSYERCIRNKPPSG